MWDLRGSRGGPRGSSGGGGSLAAGGASSRMSSYSSGYTTAKRSENCCKGKVFVARNTNRPQYERTQRLYKEESNRDQLLSCLCLACRAALHRAGREPTHPARIAVVGDIVSVQVKRLVVCHFPRNQSLVSATDNTRQLLQCSPF